MKMDKDKALYIAMMNKIPLHGDFHGLTSDVVERIISAADDWKYKKPANASGSRARYFYAFLCRKAK